MKIGIIGAMDEEVKVLLENVENLEKHTRGGLIFYQGFLGKHEVYIVKSGIGKVQMAITTTLLIEEFGVVAVVNTGSAGGIGEGLHVGDIVISEKVAYSDVDVTGFGYKFGQLPNQPLYFEASKYLVASMMDAAKNLSIEAKKGLIVSGDSFIDSDTKISTIKEHFPDALCVEMEGAAIGQVAHQFGVAFLVIRAMSDTANHEATVSFDDFIIEAGKKSAELVLEFLKTMK
jgi:adenosylhomocysteine nucleosidase